MRSLPALLVLALAGCRNDPPPSPQLSPNAGAEPSEDSGRSAVASSGTRETKIVNHVIGTGQSLSVGSAGGPAISRTQPFGNLMFTGGLIPASDGLGGFVPLVEGTSRDVETMSAGFANLVTALAADRVPRHDLLVSLHGVGGVEYAGLKKGTGPYVAGLAQVKAALAIARASGSSYVVRAVTNVHGETDHTLGNAAYEQDLAEWQASYEADVRALTGQVEPLPMLHSQMSSWTKYGQPTSAIPAAQLRASLASHGKIVLVGPKYHLPYSDGVHLTAEGYRHMGEDYAKVYRRVILEGKPWEPLRPTAVSRAGAVITIRFAVPSPPLVIDTRLVSDPGSRGFEVVGKGAAVAAIVSVTTAGDTVVLTLAAAPTATDLHVRYACTGLAGQAAGPMTGPRGNLRDSDATPSRHGSMLHNWAVHFDEPVP